MTARRASRRPARKNRVPQMRGARRPSNSRSESPRGNFGLRIHKGKARPLIGLGKFVASKSASR